MTDQSNVGPLIGTLVKDRYLIEKQLGRGGFAITYLARDNQLHSRPVVIKALLDYHADDPWALKKFRQEVEALARINHPGVVGPLDFGQLPDGRPFLVMEFIDGLRLRDVIDARGMEFQRAAGILRQVGRALTAAHEQGIFHRDVKPENIMLQHPGEEEEQAKLIDFGIANVRDSQVSGSGSTHIAGTTGYIAPELFEGQRFTTASDVYALGVVAYEMVTGRHPFNAESQAHMVRLQLDGVTVPPTALRPGLPFEAEACIEKALVVAPAERYPRPRDFGDALAAALTPDSARPRKPRRESSDEPELYNAHVLMMDIVEFSRLPSDREMMAHVELLKRIVRETPAFQQAETEHRLTPMDLGDGNALVFLGDPVLAVSCADEVAAALAANPAFQLRMGLNTGPMYRRFDIKDNTNFAGAVFNIAQRVMACGGPGDILLSRDLAGILGGLPDWAPRLQDLGEREVKHGDRVHVFRLRPQSEIATRSMELPAAPPLPPPPPPPEPLPIVDPPVFGMPSSNSATPAGAKSSRWILAIALLLLGGLAFAIYKYNQTIAPPIDAVKVPRPESQPAATAAKPSNPEPKPATEPPQEISAAKTDAPSGLRYLPIPAANGVPLGVSPGDTPTTDLAPLVFESRGFWMAETSVTVNAYARFVRATGRAMPDPPVIAGKEFNANWESRDFPMVMVDWRDAGDFCRWDGGRLPDELEWEYAARGNTTGPAYGPMDEIAWFVDNSGPRKLDGTALWNVETRKSWLRYERAIVQKGATIHPVAKKSPNAYGLYDMLGNVVNWTASSFQPGGAEKVVRGGAWGYIGPVRVSQRDQYPPSVRNGYLGFRCVIDPH